MIEEMGGACELCGATTRLEFDHTAPRTWVARKTASHYRIILYRRDWEKGHLRLLCSECNKSTGRPWIAPAAEPDEENPF